MIFRRSYSDPFRRGISAACFGPAAPALAVASLASSVIGTGMSVIGQANAAQSQAAQTSAQASYQAQVARNNQIAAQQAAQLALQQGQVQEDRQRLKTAQFLGSQRAALAGQGGDVNSGSDLDILGDTARAGEFDAQTIRNNALLQAHGLEQQAANYSGQANLYSANAANTTNGLANLPFGIGSSLLGGVSSIVDKGLKYFPPN